MNLLPHLDALDALLSDEGRWTQRIFARNAEGDSVSPSDPTAVCWCVEGAVSRVTRGDYCASIELYRALRDTLGCDYIPWQDDPDRKFSDVKQLFADTRTRLAAEGRET